MICEICKKDFSKPKGLTIHGNRVHGLSCVEYYDRFLRSETEGVCICGNDTRFVSIVEGYRKYCSIKCSALDPDTVKKRKLTTLEKYGVESTNQLQSVKDKKKQSCIAHFGVENPFHSEIVKDKSRKTLQKNYGVDHPMQSDVIKQRIARNCLDKYGVESTNQLQSVKDKKKQSCRNRYGVDNFAKTLQFRELARELFIEKIEIQRLNGEPLSPRIGKKERLCLDFLQRHLKYQIIRNGKKHSFFPDGYIQELNLIIEFDEHWHNLKCWKKRDIDREDQLKSLLNCKVFRISESCWDAGEEFVLEELKQFLKGEYEGTDIGII